MWKIIFTLTHKNIYFIYIFMEYSVIEIKEEKKTKGNLKMPDREGIL